jgi:uncharacterized protein YgiM (DUF1202 family)
MFSIKKAAAALCLSGFVIGGTATAALASTTADSQTTTTAQSQTFQVVGSWCGYQVFRAPNGLFVRTGPGRNYKIIGSLANRQKTTGDCATVRGWVHLSNKFNHWHSPASARGWSDGYYLAKPAAVMSWCGYQVYRAPNGLYVRTGPGQAYKIVGGLRNGQWTTGDCAAVKGWIHLSNKYNHYHSPASARGWSAGRYLRR